jgi:hypothetical protein
LKRRIEMKKSQLSKKGIAAVKQMESGRKTADVMRLVSAPPRRMRGRAWWHAGQRGCDPATEDENRRLKHLVADLSWTGLKAAIKKRVEPGGP